MATRSEPCTKFWVGEVERTTDISWHDLHNVQIVPLNTYPVRWHLPKGCLTVWVVWAKAPPGTQTYLNWVFFRVNSLSANPKKWSNTLKQFVGNLPTNCLSVFDHFVGLALKELSTPDWDLDFIFTNSFFLLKVITYLIKLCSTTMWFSTPLCSMGLMKFHFLKRFNNFWLKARWVL